MPVHKSILRQPIDSIEFISPRFISICMHWQWMAPILLHWIILYLFTLIGNLSAFRNRQVQFNHWTFWSSCFIIKRLSCFLISNMFDWCFFSMFSIDLLDWHIWLTAFFLSLSFFRSQPTFKSKMLIHT